MYQIVVTDDFINLMKDLPIKYLIVLTKSFLTIEPVEDKEVVKSDFVLDLLEQIKNQELE